MSNQTTEGLSLSRIRIHGICHAYESGYGRGHSERDLTQPYEPESPEGIAYHEGWAFGRSRARYERQQSPEPSGRPKNGEPYVGPEPILLGIGKIRVAICSDTDDPRHVARELVIYDDGDGPKPVGTPEPEHAGKRADQVGKVLARLRVVNAKGAMVFADDLMTVIENAARADDGFPETKVERELPSGFFRCGFCKAEAPIGAHVCGDSFTKNGGAGK